MRSTQHEQQIEETLDRIIRIETMLYRLCEHAGFNPRSRKEPATMEYLARDARSIIEE